MSWLGRLFGRSREREPRVPHAADVRARYTDSLMAADGVVSVGVGHDSNGKPTIVVGVSTAKEEAISLPRSIEGVPVIVQRVGMLKTQG